MVEALASSDTERGYPPSIGTPELRTAAQAWLRRRFGVDVPLADVAACVGTKEFVATLPQWLRLRTPDRDTVLYPAVSYPTYAMGAVLAGCRAGARAPRRPLAARPRRHRPARRRAGPVPVGQQPGQPHRRARRSGVGRGLGRAHAVPVFSDECYAEFTWDGAPRTILEHGLDGLVAVHSLSKRSNLAGLRVGFYAGDPELVHYLKEVRKHVGMLVPGPAQAAGVAALSDDQHVEVQRDRYRRRLELAAHLLRAWAGVDVVLPGGGFYLWVEVGDAWAFTEQLALEGGALVSPGEFYGPQGRRHVRVAVVQPDDRLALVAERLGLAA